jgi:sulfite exporter TauE/SafE
MCGPFVLSQTGARLAEMGGGQHASLTRLGAALLLPYHLGRLTTYAVLGAAVALPIGRARQAIDLWWLSPVLLMLAAIAFVAIALRLIGHATGSGALARFAGSSLANLARPLFLNPVGIRGYALGLLLGFLPCGLVYSALIGAAAQGNPLPAFIGMLAFGAGTIPSLFTVAYGGSWFLTRSGLDLKRLAPYLALANAAFLMAIALSQALSA